MVSEAPIQTYTLTNIHGNTVRILNRGLILQSVVIHLIDGTERECVLGLEHPDEYMSAHYLANYPCLGAVVGRYANRIRNAEFELDGQSYTLAANNGPHCLHGGLEGFDKKNWQVDLLDDQALIAQYRSPDGEEGFPGNLDCQATITWTNANELILTLSATTDKSTPINMTWHPYFNLDDSKSSIGDHQLQLFADRYLIQEEDLVPTGTIGATKGTPLDYSQLTPLQRAIDIEGVDTSFIIQQSEAVCSPAARLLSTDQKLELLISTTAPIVHIYTAGSLPTLQIAGGKQSGPYQGICLECQDYTDAVHHPQFPETILRPGQVYNRTIIHQFITR